ncbi:MAG: SLBB domain-containing protein [Bacteroidota bacterium]
MNAETRDRLRGKALILTYAALLAGCVPQMAAAQAQESGLASGLARGATASYYYIGKPGELTMQVNVWGFVRSPGRYEVPSGTDLVQLLSFAGGPTEGADMDDVRITRVIRRDTTVTRIVIEVDLEDLHLVEPAKLALYPGDTIFIDHTAWLTVRDVFSFMTTAAIISSAVVQIVYVANR